MGGDGSTPPAAGGAEFLDALKKTSGLNQLAPKAPEKIFDRPERKFGPIFEGERGTVGGWVQGVWVWGGAGHPPQAPKWC